MTVVKLDRLVGTRNGQSAMGLGDPGHWPRPGLTGSRKGKSGVVNAQLHCHAPFAESLETPTRPQFRGSSLQLARSRHECFVQYLRSVSETVHERVIIQS